VEHEKRRTPRYSFIADAEVVETASGAKLSARVSEFGLTGCYLDLTHPLPMGTSMLVKIFSGSEFFEAPGIVVYAHPNLGMGVQFHDVKPLFQNVLKKWVLAAMVGKSE
jgi:hypothetical protein